MTIELENRLIVRESLYCQPGDDPRDSYEALLDKITPYSTVRSALHHVYIRGDLCIEGTYILYYIFLSRMVARRATFLQLDLEGSFAFYSPEFGLTTDDARLSTVCATYKTDRSIWLLHMGVPSAHFMSLLPSGFFLGHVTQNVPPVTTQQLLCSAMLTSPNLRDWAEARMQERRIFDKFTSEPYPMDWSVGSLSSATVTDLVCTSTCVVPASDLASVAPDSGLTSVLPTSLSSVVTSSGSALTGPSLTPVAPDPAPAAIQNIAPARSSVSSRSSYSSYSSYSPTVEAIAIDHPPSDIDSRVYSSSSSSSRVQNPPLRPSRYSYPYLAPVSTNSLSIPTPLSSVELQPYNSACRGPILPPPSSTAYKTNEFLVNLRMLLHLI